ncbi:MAG: ABC transporter substrate-binding protein [Magnetococcus sp. MYC-9]
MLTVRPLLTRRSLFHGLFGLWLMGLTAPLQAAGPTPTPTAYMEGVVQRVLAVLRDPAMSGVEQQTARREALRKIIYGEFDFERMSQGAVGPKWPKFSDAQKKQFIVLFERLLENTYMNSVERYKNEEVRFTREVQPSGTTARVDTVVISKGAEFKISYHLEQQGAGWKVADVTIEGVSVVANYRAQFKQLLRTGEPAEIDAMLVSLENSANRSEK